MGKIGRLALLNLGGAQDVAWRGGYVGQTRRAGHPPQGGLYHSLYERTAEAPDVEGSRYRGESGRDDREATRPLRPVHCGKRGSHEHREQSKH
jgi:hypothetical protein